jgi:hypothetical protein
VLALNVGAAPWRSRSRWWTRCSPSPRRGRTGPTTAPGHLVNGSATMPQAVQVRAGTAAFAPVGASPTGLASWAGPVSGDTLTLDFKQPVAANDALRSGTYAKTLTFTLSTTAP